MTGRSPLRGSGSRPSGGAATASPAEPSIPNALESLDGLSAVDLIEKRSLASIAISLKRFADMCAEDRKPRLELMPEGYIGEQEHRRFMRDSFIRDLAAWESIADAVTYIAGRMPLPASAIEARQRPDPEEGLDPKGESAVAESETPEPSSARGEQGQ